MKKYNLFGSSLNYLSKVLLLVFTIFWIYVSSSRLFTFEYSFKSVAVVFIFLLLILWSKSREVLIKFGIFLINNKIIIMLAMIIFQVLVVISSNLMIRSDAAYLWNSAIKVNPQDKIIKYLTLNPNNLSLFVYERNLFNIFGDKSIWIAHILSMIYVDSAIVILYLLIKKFYSQKSANIAFVLFCLILGFSPQFMTVYNDQMSVAIAAIQLCLIAWIFKDYNNFLPYILLGLFTGLTTNIRITILILVIAFVLVYLGLKNNQKFLSKSFRVGLLIITLLVSNLVMTGIASRQAGFDLEKGQGKSLLWFFDLGLTYNGGDQLDLLTGLNEEARTLGKPITNQEVIKKDITRRIKAYTPKTMLGHLKVKTKGTLDSGDLGWVYANPDQEIDKYYNPLYDKIKDNKILSKFSKTFVYMNNKEYKEYAIYLQMVWIVIACGFFASLFIGKVDYLLLTSQVAVLGGLVFLTFFEGGKARYMIQFLPQIILAVALGIDNISAIFQINQSRRNKRQ